MPRSRSVISAFGLVLVGCFCGFVRAGTFNYDLLAATGDGGSTLGGTFTLDGNLGDSVSLAPGFPGIDTFNIEWNSGTGTIVDWNPGDLGLVEISSIDFSGHLGDSALTPVGDNPDNYFYLGTFAYGEPFVVELGFDGTTPQWEVGIYRVGV